MACGDVRYETSCKHLQRVSGGTGVEEKRGTYCFKKSLLRALLFGSRPGGGFPMVPTVAALGFTPVHAVPLIHVCVRLGGPPEAAPLGTEPVDIRSGGNGESAGI